jgi:hypothetical protein
MAVQQGRRRVETGGVPSGYVEDFDEPRTKLEGIFSILLRIIILSPAATSHTLGSSWSWTCTFKSVAVTH